jgi:hypothetical protein
LHRRTKQRGETHGEKVANALDRDIRRRISCDDGRIVCELALARKHRGDAISPSPDSLHRGKDTKFVVNQHVVLRRIALLNIVQNLFLVDVDQDVACDLRILKTLSAGELCHWRIIG